MNLFKKTVLFLLVTFCSTNLLAYSYAAAGKEPTIDSREAILKYVNKNDYKNAKKEFDKAKKNYTYLSTVLNDNLFSSLNKAIEDQDSMKIHKWLNISLAAEISRRLDGGLKNIKTYNISKVMLAKANKYYKLLEPTLTKENADKLSVAIKNCMQAIGNPGLFGVGAKKADEAVFKQNQLSAVKILTSL